MYLIRPIRYTHVNVWTGSNFIDQAPRNRENGPGRRRDLLLAARGQGFHVLIYIDDIDINLYPGATLPFHVNRT